MTLKRIIEKCKENDRSAQRQIYDLLASKLYTSALKYAASEQDAQDVLQDSFIKIFKSIGQFNHQGSFEGWCRRLVINTALARYRRNKLKTVSDDALVHVAQVNEVEEVDEVDLKTLLSFIQELPERYRLVFSLYVLDDYSHREIASLMEISEGTSKSNLNRARGILKDKIKAWQNSQNSSAI